MMVQLKDIVYQTHMRPLVETAPPTNRRALIETAARLIRSRAPRTEVSVTRRLQKLINANANVRRVFESLPASSQHRIGLSVGTRPASSGGRLLAMTPAQLWETATAGKLLKPKATKPRPQGKRLLEMSPDELWALHTG